MSQTEKWFTVKILTNFRKEIAKSVGIGKSFSSTSSFIDSAIRDKLEKEKNTK